MEDNKNLETTHNEGQDSQQEEKVFTQTEVEEIIKKRLARERRKAGQETDKDPSLADRENSLAERELKITAREKLQTLGLPLTLADILRYNDEKTLDAAIEAINELNENDGVSKAWGKRLANGTSKPSVDPIRKAMGLGGKE